MSAENAQGNSLRTALFSFKGRLSRARFWEYAVAVNIVSGILFFAICVLLFNFSVSERTAGSPGGHVPVLAVAIILLYLGASLWVSLALLSKRFHDRGRTGWLALIGFVQILGFLWIVVDAYLLPGRGEANRYGPVPSRPSRSPAAEISSLGRVLQS